jgi:hypothetical protein
MNSYEITLWALAGGLLGQIYAAGIAVEAVLGHGQPAIWRRIWLAFASSSMLLALHHGYALELALRTGLHDMRQAVLAGLAGVAFALGSQLLRRQPS